MGIDGFTVKSCVALFGFPIWFGAEGYRNDKDHKSSKEAGGTTLNNFY